MQPAPRHLTLYSRPQPASRQLGAIRTCASVVLGTTGTKFAPARPNLLDKCLTAGASGKRLQGFGDGIIAFSGDLALRRQLIDQDELQWRHGRDCRIWRRAAL